MTRQLSVPQVRLFFTLHLGIAFFGGLWIGAVLSPNIKGTRASRTPHNLPSHPTPPPPPVKAGARIYTSEELREWTFGAARKCRVPPPLLFSQVRQESAFKVNALSSAGAVGLMQVKPYHFSWPLDPWDPETNLNVGACLLRRHYERMGSWKLALDAYHGGQYRRTTSRTTRSYTSRVMKGAE
jgi:soluble lytic murein transglycosylase-like protein